MRKYYVGPITDHYNGNVFFNPEGEANLPPFAALRWKLTSRPAPWPEHVDNQFADIPPARIENDAIRASWVGHATALIQTAGLNILTDPVWAERASPFKSIGPKRVCNPGIAFEDLPKIDVILVSHNHYDHLDLDIIARLWQRDKPVIITPLGNRTIIMRHDPHIRVIELDWGQSHDVAGASFHCEPCYHWSARWINDRSQALWSAFVISTQAANIYFSGDTGYNEGRHFKKTYEKFGNFKFALLPIGAYEPNWFMKYHHMNPEEAVHAWQHLGKPLAMGIHFATFQLTDEAYDAPEKAFIAAKQKHHVEDDVFRALKVGESWQIPL